MRTIQAKFRCRCGNCNRQIQPGENILWARGQAPLCVTCPETVAPMAPRRAQGMPAQSTPPDSREWSPRIPIPRYAPQRTPQSARAPVRGHNSVAWGDWEGEPAAPPVARVEVLYTAPGHTVAPREGQTFGPLTRSHSGPPAPVVPGMAHDGLSCLRCGSDDTTTIGAAIACRSCDMAPIIEAAFRDSPKMGAANVRTPPPVPFTRKETEQLDMAIERAWGRLAHGVRVSILHIPLIFKECREAVQQRGSEIDAAVLAAVAKYREN